MAHRGKFYPVNQSLRLYWADDNWTFPIPLVSYLSWGGLTNGISAPIDGDHLEAAIAGWTPGDYVVTYRSGAITYAGHSVEFGWQLEIDSMTGLRSRWMQFWCDGAEQLQRHNSTGTGNAWNTFGLGSPGLWAVPGWVLRINFFVDQLAKPWADF